MKDLDLVHYCVHMWFDKWEHPNFEQAFSTRAEQIRELSANWLSQAFVFVDTPVLSKAQAQYYNLLALADTIQDFINHMHLCWSMPSLKEVWLQRLHDPEEYNQEVIADLYEIFKADIPHLTTDPISPRPSMTEIMSTLWLDEKLKATYKEHDKLYISIFEERFLAILKMLWKKYRNKNIWKFSYTDWESVKLPRNVWRRKRIYDKISSIEWLPILQWYMIDWDPNRWERDTRDFIKDYTANREVVEYGYGNAFKSTYRLWGIVHSNRIKWYFDWLNNEIISSWYRITDSTKHLICWEYFWRCVWGFTTLFNRLTWVNEENILMDQNTSLVHKDDMDKFEEHIVRANERMQDPNYVRWLTDYFKDVMFWK